MSSNIVCTSLNTSMKHLSVVGCKINSALLFMVLAKGFTFQIIEEALSTAIDSMTWMVNAVAGQPTKRKETMFLHSLMESIYLLSDTASRKVRIKFTHRQDLFHRLNRTKGLPPMDWFNSNVSNHLYFQMSPQQHNGVLLNLFQTHVRRKRTTLIFFFVYPT